MSTKSVWNSVHSWNNKGLYRKHEMPIWIYSYDNYLCLTFHSEKKRYWQIKFGVDINMSHLIHHNNKEYYRSGKVVCCSQK